MDTGYLSLVLALDGVAVLSLVLAIVAFRASASTQRLIPGVRRRTRSLGRLPRN